MVKNLVVFYKDQGGKGKWKREYWLHTRETKSIDRSWGKGGSIKKGGGPKVI